MDSNETAPAASGLVEEEEDEWELCNDDGFVYKRKRRRRIESTEAIEARSSADRAAEVNRWRERKKKTLLKIRARYVREIEQWENLSTNLQAMEERTRELQEQYRQEREQRTAPFSEVFGSPVSQRKGISCGSTIDDILSQVEAQESIIGHFSNLCDIAEALCSSQEEQLKQCLIDLPIWASPRELMASLCDE